MIEKAAVIVQLENGKMVIIPCHRHCDAYEILNMFQIKYKKVDEGFLDEFDKFHDRLEACKIAKYYGQIENDDSIRRLYSEDLW